jgi:hypothetical protein
MPTKSEKLKSLVRKAMEAEALYMSLVGTGLFEQRIYKAIFKWPDVVISIIEDNIEQATEDVAAIILFAMRPIAHAYISQIKGIEQYIYALGKEIDREPNKRDVDDVLAWYENATKMIEKLKKEVS